ncbi:winged helix-turn-helix domain-containing protein [Ralstonia chuxiongensis]|uniref:Winged helix-turn-helix domain-containing protein n=1 Tax=Ralstonia chuxiongensis TaxID=2957504 RepID=A0AA41X085_9RALS|nr:winged helix-turn-helix domain-containing protein [Ralstonia chuxiongensis]MCP1175692.1 winged helix-turn-helix domain-containing protein [Ralstonia chuxiongensis]
MGSEILLVVQDQAQRDRLSFVLRDAGHRVQFANGVDQVQATVYKSCPHMMLMEWAWPKQQHAIDQLLALRSDAYLQRLPIIVVSRHSSIPAKISALNAGADDYIVDPCDPAELHARIRSILRRCPTQHVDNSVQLNDLRLDPLTLSVTAETPSGQRPIPVTPLEFRLLHFLVMHPQHLHSRANLLDRVWGGGAYVGERTVDVHIRKLRVALAGTGCDGLIQTVRGEGYRLARRSVAIQVERSTKSPFENSSRG